MLPVQTLIDDLNITAPPYSVKFIGASNLSLLLSVTLLGRYTIIIIVIIYSYTEYITTGDTITRKNNAVIDHRLRPLCCHLESYFKRPQKVVPCVRWPATGITAHSL